MEKAKISVSDNLSVRGVLSYKVFRHINGEKHLLENFDEENLIVDAARDSMARLVAGETAGFSIAEIGFGVSGAIPALSDTGLTNPFRKSVDGFIYPAMGQVQFNWSLSLIEGNGLAIMEFGLYTANGRLFARRVRTSPINKEADISLEGIWTIIF
jgi:hypothetical protein